jgi:hypothetical protein
MEEALQVENALERVLNLYVAVRCQMSCWLRIAIIE